MFEAVQSMDSFKHLACVHIKKEILHFRATEVGPVPSIRKELFILNLPGVTGRQNIFFSGMSEDRVSLNGPPDRVFKQSLPQNCFTLQWQPNLRTKHMEHDTCDRFNSMKLKPLSGRQEIKTIFLKRLPVKSSSA